MERGAGVILIKFIDDEPHILGLRIYRSYDLPKGHIENDEDTLTAAKRETQEEAGISDIRFPWGYDTLKLRNRSKKEVTLYLGTTHQVPILSRNPESGEYEHHGVKWLTLDQASEKLHPYLRPAVDWVKKCLDAENAVKTLIRNT